MALAAMTAPAATTAPTVFIDPASVSSGPDVQLLEHNMPMRTTSKQFASNAALTTESKPTSVAERTSPGPSLPDPKPASTLAQPPTYRSSSARAATGNLVLVDWKHKHDQTLTASLLTRSDPENIYETIKDINNRPTGFESKKIIGMKPAAVRMNAENVLHQYGESITEDAVDDVLGFLMPLAHGNEGDVERMWQKYVVTAIG